MTKEKQQNESVEQIKKKDKHQDISAQRDPDKNDPPKRNKA
jgi:hypothetical protein